MINYKKDYFRIIEKLEYLLKKYYASRLTSIVLFGSVGRNKFHPESDIDILIVIKDAPKGRSNRFFEYYENVFLKLERDIQNLAKKKLNIMVSPAIKTIAEVEYGSPLFIEMADECRILFDENNFFAGVLKKLQTRLKEYKSEKVFYKGRYYWRLKPDYKWGEEIIL